MGDKPENSNPTGPNKEYGLINRAIYNANKQSILDDPSYLPTAKALIENGGFLGVYKPNGIYQAVTDAVLDAENILKGLPASVDKKQATTPSK